jgi:hypothetical protein
VRPLTDPEIEARFVERLRPEGDCLVWDGARDGKGYGSVYVGKGRCVKAHRFVWTLAYGTPGDLHVCQRCDNPPCCKLDHLFLAPRPCPECGR